MSKEKGSKIKVVNLLPRSRPTRGPPFLGAVLVGWLVGWFSVASYQFPGGMIKNKDQEQ